MKTRNQLALAPWVFTIAFFALWEIFCRALKISSFILPAPSTILWAVWEYRTQLAYHAMHTLWMTLAGFGLAVGFGLLLGMVLGSSRLINAGTYPLLVGFNSIPKVAVVPILVFWFGVGWVPPVMTAFLISFFPIVVNVATGIATVEPEMEDVLRALGASKRDIVFKVGVPRAMPYFFGSLKVAITLAYVGSVIGEQNASNVGIGNLLTRASAAFEVPLVWAALVVLAVLGVIMYAITAYAERSMTGWAQRSQMAA
jgi:NitT/TauT family transport system permease protein